MSEKKPKKARKKSGDIVSWTKQDARFRQQVSFPNKMKFMVPGFFAGFYGKAIFVDFGGSVLQLCSIADVVFHGQGWADFGLQDPKVAGPTGKHGKRKR